MDFINLILASLPDAVGGIITAAILGTLAYLFNIWRSGITVSPNKILHNLPRPDYIEFVGRINEVQSVVDGLISRSYLISIDGIGGIGKSALALEVGHRLLRHKIISHGKKLPSKFYFNAIIWVSAKRFSLRTDGIVTRDQETQTFQGILNTIAITLGKTKYIELEQNKKKELIRMELAKHRALLIIDNFESIDDEMFLEFLRELPEPAKAIITTRHQIGETYSVHLPGLSERDAFSLMRTEADLRSITLSLKQMEKVYHRTGGVPLAIVWTIARMEYQNPDDVLTDIRVNDDSVIAHYCFHEVVTSLKKKESYHTLLALSLFNNKASREALGFVTGFPPHVRDATLAELEKLCLINKISNNFWMLPLTREFVTTELNIIENIELKEKLKRQFADYYNQIKIYSAKKAVLSIKAIHLALESRSLFVWNDTISDYLEANRDAVSRGVKIVRIFLMDKDVVTNDFQIIPSVIGILDAQRSAGIQVKILWADILNRHRIQYPPDLIIFDDREVHVHKGSGGWYTEVEIIEDEKQIENWVKNYYSLEKYCVVWNGRGMIGSKK
jgi:hypothetical protein